MRFEENSKAMQGLARSSQSNGGTMVNANAKRSRQAGFTLAELLAVVAMIAILATIAGVSYRRYMASSKVSEATAMVGQIRAAQENYRAETMRYFNVTQTAGNWYPDRPNSKKRSWDFESHADYARWRELGVRSDGPVYFGYATYAGTAGTKPTDPTGTTATFNFPAAPIEPWYVIQAAADLDENGKFCYVVGSSFTGEIYVENEGE